MLYCMQLRSMQMEEYLNLLLTEADAIISDELNHASIIDGIRLCKTNRFRYKHNDMNDLSLTIGGLFKL